MLVPIRIQRVGIPRPASIARDVMQELAVSLLGEHRFSPKLSPGYTCRRARWYPPRAVQRSIPLTE